MAIIGVVNRKGGVGKSVVALHLAAALHDQGLSVALVDLDGPNGTCVDVASGGELHFLVVDAPTWDVKHAASRWDHVVLDGYARADDALAALAALADHLVVPTLPDAGGLRVLARFLPSLQGVAARYRVLLNAVPPYPSREGEFARRDLVAGNVPLYQTEIPRAAAFAHGMRAQQLAWQQPGGRGLEQIFAALAKEVVG